MQDEDPIDLTVTLPSGSSIDGAGLSGYLEDELRTRAEVVSTEGNTLTVRAYRREEVEAVADELVTKLSRFAPDGAAVRWVDEGGADVVRPL